MDSTSRWKIRAAQFGGASMSMVYRGRFACRTTTAISVAPRVQMEITSTPMSENPERDFLLLTSSTTEQDSSTSTKSCSTTKTKQQQQMLTDAHSAMARGTPGWVIYMSSVRQS